VGGAGANFLLIVGAHGQCEFKTGAWGRSPCSRGHVAFASANGA